MKQIIIGAVVGGIVLFAWQFAAWEFLDIHKLDQEPVLKTEAAITAALEGSASGIYWIPGISQADYKAKGAAYEAYKEKCRKGPNASIILHASGKAMMDKKQLAIGGVLCGLIALVASILLRSAAIHNFFGRFLFVTLLGVFLALAMDGQGWNWMNNPLDWTRGFVVDHVLGMAATGIFLAMIVKPSPKPA